MTAYFSNTDEKKLTGIVIVPDPVIPKKVEGKKYEHIDNTAAGVTTFLTTMKQKFPTATHCNFYGKRKKYFIDRINLE